MKIDHLPGQVPQHVRGIAPNDTATPDGPDQTGDTDGGAGLGGFDDAVEVELSETAQQLGGPGNSVAHQARAAMAAGFADSSVPFGHIVRQIAQGHDFAAAAAAAAVVEEEGEGEPTEAVAPTTDETSGETAETSAPPTEEVPVADGDLAIDLGAGDVADPDLALLDQLIEDLANDDDDTTV